MRDASERPSLDVFAPIIAKHALAGLHREYPNKLAHLLVSSEDVASPRQLHPLFFGCFDWHSAVHSHWALARLLRLRPEASWAEAVVEALDESFCPENVAGELDYLATPGRESFEMPYGVAWLVQLGAELHRLRAPSASAWRQTIAPLEVVAADRLAGWLSRLHRPVRTGAHGQSAFAMALALDWARARHHTDLEALVVVKAHAFYGNDSAGPIGFEPSAYDFLSPCLAEGDLMRRVLAPDTFSEWLHGFLPGIERGTLRDRLVPVEPLDRADGRLVHFDGLNLSRAWMLDGIAAALSEDDPRGPVLSRLAVEHGRAGLGGLHTDHYAGTHWLGTFALYWLTSDLHGSPGATRPGIGKHTEVT
jgi:hypothetical protein